MAPDFLAATVQRRHLPPRDERERSVSSNSGMSCSLQTRTWSSLHPCFRITSICVSVFILFEFSSSYRQSESKLKLRVVLVVGFKESKSSGHTSAFSSIYDDVTQYTEAS